MINLCKLAAGLLVVILVVVCLSPLVDLDPTAMRAFHAAQAFFLALASAAFLILPFSVSDDYSSTKVSSENIVPSQDDLLDRICARLC